MSKKFGIISTIISCVAIALSIVAIVFVSVKFNNSKNYNTQYILYLGTNDKDTNLPVFTEDVAKQKAEEVLIDKFGGYTIQEAHGGWKDDGTTYQEYTIVIYLSDTTLDKVHDAADKLIEVFNQSSILIEANQTVTEFYAGK
ncbi:MAG: hypothetical protein IJ538_03765 [Clostridia bacterium]|nr:hypothetical protein [Clostridia bacterium]